MTGFDVAISLGNRDGDAVDPDGVVFQHHLADRARIDAEVLSGGHLLHLAVAGCLFNDILRAASSRDIKVNDLRVEASGGFEGDPLLSTGITYSIEIEGGGLRAGAAAARPRCRGGGGHPAHPSRRSQRRA